MNSYEAWLPASSTHAIDWGPADARDRTSRCSKSRFDATRGSLRSWSTTARRAWPTRRHHRTPPPGHRQATQFDRRRAVGLSGFAEAWVARPCGPDHRVARDRAIDKFEGRLASGGRGRCPSMRRSRTRSPPRVQRRAFSASRPGADVRAPAGPSTARGLRGLLPCTETRSITPPDPCTDSRERAGQRIVWCRYMDRYMGRDMHPARSTPCHTPIAMSSTRSRPNGRPSPTVPLPDSGCERGPAPSRFSPATRRSPTLSWRCTTVIMRCRWRCRPRWCGSPERTCWRAGRCCR